jgi:hypothetical protein
MLMIEPATSFDPLIEGRQHPLCPDRRFDPSPSGLGLSGASSPFGHCLQSVFLRIGHRVSTSLPPFAPPELPGFDATLGALTPGRSALRLSHEHRLDRRPGLPVLCQRTFRSFRLQSPPVVPTPFWGFSRRAYRTTGLVVAPFREPVRHLGFALDRRAHHDSRPNRVHLRYGLIVHLRLLSTPPRGDAVTFGYGVPEHSGKDSHPAGSMHLQAHRSPLRGCKTGPLRNPSRALFESFGPIG